MKINLRNLTLAFCLLSSTLAFADGPCGNGTYVYRCTPGRCGEPANCHMECDGPDNTADTEVSNTVIMTVPDGDKAFQLPQHISILSSCI